ncbi:MAG: FAD-dependent oxidoreductase [Pseudobutyrivibrio sp.]|nr:FAD-dependent oxidoreductase [Pseudobutyrivibrio sp.]
MSKVVIIGGVAGGASAAARLRRLDETMEIVVLERGDYISYANCGLPYYIGDVIKDRDALLLQTPEMMKSRFNVDVRVQSEVTAINPDEHKVTVKKRSGETYEESYDDLVIATGSSPLVPPIEGIKSKGIYTLWTVNDTDKIRGIVDNENPKTAVVVGGGFIGLEMAENLYERGIKVTLIEGQNQVMAPLDFEMASLLHGNMKQKGVDLRLGQAVSAFKETANGVAVTLADGSQVEAELVILSIGVRPNSQLAKDCGIETNARGGIVVDNQMHTSAKDIWAVGDVIEVDHYISKERTMIPLAGPANKQGRMVADLIIAKRNGDTSISYKGTMGTSVAKVFDYTAAAVGLSEKALIAKGQVKGQDYMAATIVQKDHAGYYPDATILYLKLIYKMDGTILGAQVVGPKGADKRIDIIATAIRFGAKAWDLKELELAYAPPFASAKDPINMLGFVSENIREGIVSFRNVMEVAQANPSELVILDVREDIEREVWAPANSIHVPFGQVRNRLGEIPKDKEVCVSCAIGVRAYNVARILMQSGFDNITVLDGGATLYRAYLESLEDVKVDEGLGTPSNQVESDDIKVTEIISVDCSGLQCPGPIMKVNQKMKELEDGACLRVSATDMGFTRDVKTWCERTGNTFIKEEREGNSYIATLKKGKATAQVATPAATSASLPQGKTMIVFDGDFDKALASFIIANGAASMGRPVTMFFTFWGLNILRKSNKVKVKKSLVEKMFGAMMPRGTGKLTLSKMNMGGMGTKMMKAVMKDKNVSSLEELIKSAMDNGVKIVACTMSMDVMGIRKEELIDGVEFAGVASYLGDAENANVNLFI